MKLKFNGKKFSLTITKSIENNNDVIHIEMDPDIAENLQLVNDAEGFKTTIRIEGKEQIEDFISVISKFKDMMDV